MKRSYRLKERARRQEETRRRIVEATVALHTSVGPARTTISAIADGAGVERHTVYAHFPSDRPLFEACSAHWRATHPFPDGSRWRSHEDAGLRLQAALDQLYAWYEEVEHDLALFDRDAAVHAMTGELQRSRQAVLAELRDELAAGRRRRKAVRAAIGHALDFETWRSLTRRQGLTRRQAVDAMSTLVASI
jgi:AcrR family transcriptional regulator